MKKIPKRVAPLLRQFPESVGRGDDVNVPELVRDLGALIDEARRQVATAADATLVQLHWQIGYRVQKEVLERRRAEYGGQIVAAVSRQLEARYGRGFNEKSVRRMVQFASMFTDPKIVATLSRQLGWSHFVELIPIKDALARDFYAEICRVERWSVRQLRERIVSMLYERTALSKKPEALALREELSALRDKDELSPTLVFRDPYKKARDVVAVPDPRGPFRSHRSHPTRRVRQSRW